MQEPIFMLNCEKNHNNTMLLNKLLEKKYPAALCALWAPLKTSIFSNVQYGKYWFFQMFVPSREPRNRVFRSSLILLRIRHCVYRNYPGRCEVSKSSIVLFLLMIAIADF